MKRVRYLAGLVGLVPAAGLAAPAAAYASTTPAHITASLAKTVRLAAISPDVCYGHTSAGAAAYRIAEEFWYNTSGCIGTVVEYVYVSSPAVATTFSLNIYHSHQRVGHQSYNAGSLPVGDRSHAFYVHKRFTTPVQVCVSAWDVISLGPACTTVY